MTMVCKFLIMDNHTTLEVTSEFNFRDAELETVRILVFAVVTPTTRTHGQVQTVGAQAASMEGLILGGREATEAGGHNGQ